MARECNKAAAHAEWQLHVTKPLLFLYRYELRHGAL